MVNDLRPAQARAHARSVAFLGAIRVAVAANFSNVSDNGTACRWSRVLAVISRLFGFITVAAIIEKFSRAARMAATAR